VNIAIQDRHYDVIRGHYEATMTSVTNYSCAPTMTFVHIVVTDPTMVQVQIVAQKCTQVMACVPIVAKCFNNGT
jgi:hypothetical protein